MSVEIEEFSLRRMPSQMREFNTVTQKNCERIAPYFWWARGSNWTRFKFLFSGMLTEKLSRYLADLPYNKKFIIRSDGAFAGVIGLDLCAQNAFAPEVWLFVDAAHAGRHVASSALKKVEDYARTKSVYSIRARTAPDNKNSRHLLTANNYNRVRATNDSVIWRKLLDIKTVEK